jgi:tRNA threonylcarbamoyladenosine biosynthesis protein TsaE
MTNARKTLRLRTSSEDGTLELGRAFGAALFGVEHGVTVLLSGELAAGKTTLVRGVGEALGAARVRSPSFTLVNEYRAALNVAHVDLYRLTTEGAEDLGLEEYNEAPGVLLVEWPERWSWEKWESPPERDVFKVFIESSGENERVFEISSKGKCADLALQKLREAIEDGKTDPGVGLRLALD